MGSLQHGERVRNNILDFITGYIQQHGYAPTYREIGEGVNLQSTSSVYSHIERMLELGVLETDVGIGIPRALRVPGWSFVKNNHIRLIGGCKMTDEQWKENGKCSICRRKDYCTNLCRACQEKTDCELRNAVAKAILKWEQENV